jgi:hypothetical protein
LNMEWIKKGLIFQPDCKLEWSQTHAQVPIVDKVNSTMWRIYYSSRDKKGRSRIGYIEVESKNPKNIVYAHREPILELGAVGSFDDCGTMPTCVINREGKKYLYYIGWTTGGTVPFRNSVGLAISSDNGRSFVKYSEGPILGASIHDASFTGTMYVFEEDNLYHGFYLSCYKWEMHQDHLEPYYDIKYAKSIDSVNWDRAGKVAVRLGGNEGGIASAAVVKHNDHYKMWYSIRGERDYRTNHLNAYRIGYAESLNLTDWKRKDHKAGISKSEEGWDSEMIAYPNVIEFEDTYYLFYNGNGFGKTGFGYAIMNLN